MSFNMMMTPVSNQYAADSESLQADVMRFMAIIGFCLIAILALVRNVEPTDSDPASPIEPTPPLPDLALAAEPEPLVTIARTEPTPPVSEPDSRSITVPVVAPRAEPEPAVKPRHEPEPQLQVQPQQSLEPVSQVLPEPPPRVEPAPQVERPLQVERPPQVEPAPAPAPTEEQGLVLRFASDGDFLRLIARGDITVYAFQDKDVLSLDQSYRFLDSHSPGQVYELLRASIPDHIVAALQSERSDIRGYRWGIALPTRISHQIERHLNTVEQGQLVINRFGEVRHVVAS